MALTAVNQAKDNLLMIFFRCLGMTFKAPDFPVDGYCMISRHFLVASPALV
jgi:hypothetical protein